MYCCLCLIILLICVIPTKYLCFVCCCLSAVIRRDELLSVTQVPLLLLQQHRSRATRDVFPNAGADRSYIRIFMNVYTGIYHWTWHSFHNKQDSTHDLPVLTMSSKKGNEHNLNSPQSNYHSTSITIERV